MQAHRQGRWPLATYCSAPGNHPWVLKYMSTFRRHGRLPRDINLYWSWLHWPMKCGTWVLARGHYDIMTLVLGKHAAEVTKCQWTKAYKQVKEGFWNSWRLEASNVSTLEVLVTTPLRQMQCVNNCDRALVECLKKVLINLHRWC